MTASGKYKKCSLLASCTLQTARCSQSRFFISARARKKIAMLACSRMLATTIRHPLFFTLLTMFYLPLSLSFLFSSSSIIVVSKMGILAQTSNFQKCIKKTNKIPDYVRDYKNEYLFIRGIDKACGEFVKRIDVEGKIFNSPQSNKVKLYFNKFLKAQEIEYPNDISEIYFKEKDVRFIETLERNLDDYMDLFYDPDGNEFDQEKYENDYSGLKEFIESFSKFKDKINIEE